jgi:hypothetical protein
MNMELHARTSDPETSHEAMARLDRKKMGDAVTQVIALYKQHARLADYELRPLFEAVWGIDCCDHLYQQARSVARDAGHVRDSGEKAVNPATNRRQVIWEYVADPIPMHIENCPTCGHVTRRTA